MENNTSETDNLNAAPEPTLTLGVPKEMAVADICRGAQAGWSVLIDAVKELESDPDFSNEYPHLFASEKGGLLGEPKQLLSGLTVDSGLLGKSAPPADIYARSVWLTGKVYQAAQTISVTLKQVSSFLSANNAMAPADVAELMKEVLSDQTGLTFTAGNMGESANDFSVTLQALGGDLEAAQNELLESTAKIENQKLFAGKPNMLQSIHAHQTIVLASQVMSQQFNASQVAAAKVAVFGVVENMTQAVKSLSEAWLTTKNQFAAVAASDPNNLGNIAFLQNSLNIESSAEDWATFAGIVKNYLTQVSLLG